MLGAGGYYIYKKRFDSFNFVQYRRMGSLGTGMYGGNGGMFGGNGGMFGGNNGMFNGSGGMYGGGGMDHGSAYANLNQSTTFEPPTLPPTPTMMGTEMT